MESAVEEYPWALYQPVKLQSIEVKGDGGGNNPIVFVHGLLCSSSTWLQVSQTIAQRTGRHVILPDLRNHGRSPFTEDHTYQLMAADLRNFIGERGLTNVTLIGHSMGARVVMLLSLLDASKIKDVVILDSSPIQKISDTGVNVLTTMMDAMQKINLDHLEWSLSEEEIQAKVDIQTKAFGVDDQLLRKLLLALLDRNPEKRTFNWLANLEVLKKNLIPNLRLLPERQYWKPFQGQTLFLLGENSGYAPEQDYPEIRESAFPKAKFDIIPGAGHWIYHDNPVDFMNKLIPFLMK